MKVQPLAWVPLRVPVLVSESIDRLSADSGVTRSPLTDKTPHHRSRPAWRFLGPGPRRRLAEIAFLHCFWPGVICDARSGRVVALELGGRLGAELSMDEEELGRRK